MSIDIRVEGFLRFRIVAIFFISLFILCGPASVLAFDKVAVLYPNAKDPYRAIYQEILSGIKTQDNYQVVEVVLEKDFKVGEVISSLKSLDISRVITLGRAGYKLAKSMPKEISVVSGAIPFSPNGVSGISLISEPDNLFAFLSQVAPQVKTVHVAYSKRSSWIIDLAKQAAQQRGLELNLKQVSNTGEAVEFYEQLFESDVSKEDAIWLPIDRVSSHDKVTLPLILEKAWAREVVVFSSKPSHAKRGALFSTYPDNVGLGKNLLLMLRELSKEPGSKQFSALKNLQLAVNLRTAAHLGLKYSTEEQENFKLTFPE